MEKNQTEYLTSNEVLSILRITSRTLLNYRKEGKLPYTKVSAKKILYKKEDVVELLNKSSVCSYIKDNYEKYIDKK